MSASEKLRALDGAISGREATDNPSGVSDALFTAARALPLIADVVQEAEIASVRRRGFLENDELRAALTALQEHLEQTP